MQEINVIGKHLSRNQTRVALVYPSVYPIAMASLATKLLYSVFNLTNNLNCERVFVPTVDGHAVTLTTQPSFVSIPRSIETNTVLSHFNILAVSLSFELDYVNFIRMLRISNIPVFRHQRTNDDLIIIAGGPAVTGNPLPLAPVVDAIILGEIEPIVEQLLEILASNDKQGVLEQLATLPGVFIPEKTDPLASPLLQSSLEETFQPTCQVRPIIPAKVKSDLDKYLIEITRGCNHRCHFCMIGNMFSPARELPLNLAQELIAKGVTETATQRIELIGSSLSEYKQLLPLLQFLNEQHYHFSLPSIRIDSDPQLIQEIVRSGQQSLTIAPEVASDTLRYSIGKRITNEQFMQFVARVKEQGIRKLKIYYMIGLPNQDDTDIDEFCKLTATINNYFPYQRQRLTVSPFVAKKRTKLSDYVYDLPKITKMSTYLRKQLSSFAKITFPSPDWGYIQWLLSSGSEDMAQVLLDVSNTPGTLLDWKRTLIKYPKLSFTKNSSETG